MQSARVLLPAIGQPPRHSGAFPRPFARLRAFLQFIFLLALLCGCAPAAASPLPAPTGTSSPSAAPSATAASTATTAPALTATARPTPSPSPSPSPSASPSPVPTYLKLRGVVTIEQAVCHYGPGAPYLYKYGVYQGSNLEVLRRVEGGNYIEVQAIGGSNACWVREDYLALKGSLTDLQPVPADQVALPLSPYYGPPTGVSASRAGSRVTVSWNALVLRAGDDSEQTPYIVEAWVCRAGQIVFEPAGTYHTSVEITDEPGCAAPSRARLLAAEKHGYTLPVEIPWPAP